MGKTFAVTGMGRCGTLFLATTLNRSPSWNVQHEPGGKRSSLDCCRRFQGANLYGEVNSYLRWFLLDLPVTRRAILLRHPRQIVVSAYNKKKWMLTKDLRVDIATSLRLIDKHIDRGIRAFRFEKYTKDPAELQQLVDYVGIDDLTITADMLKTRMNATPMNRRRVDSIAQLSDELQRWYHSALGWFEEKYYDGIPA